VRIAIIVVVLIGLAAVLGAIIVGSRSFEGIVTKHPYEKGLQWDKIQEERLSLGWKADFMNSGFTTGENEMVIILRGRDDLPMRDAHAVVTLSRPNTVAYDRTYNFAGTGGGLYRGKVQFPLYGNWDVNIHIVRGGDSLDLVKEIYVEKGQGGA
jgi:nitrogen fixation protein FixH